MNRIGSSALGAFAATGALCASRAAVLAQAVQVVGNGSGEHCWKAAKATTFLKWISRPWRRAGVADAVGACDDALKSQQMDRNDMASTWGQPGHPGDEPRALQERPGQLQGGAEPLPKLPEAHVDLGSALINLQEFAEGAQETELPALCSGRTRPERGYYNLGIAYEELGDLQESYENFRHASELAPDWQDPQQADGPLLTVKEVQK